MQLSVDTEVPVGSANIDSGTCTQTGTCTKELVSEFTQTEREKKRNIRIQVMPNTKEKG